MSAYLIHGAKSANQICSALVSAPDESAALEAAASLGVRTADYAQATEVSPNDLSTPDVGFYGPCLGAHGNGVWPDAPRGA